MPNVRLRAALSHAGLTVDELAEIVQVDVKTVYRWLAGRNPRARYRTKIALALGAQEQELWPDTTPQANRGGTPPARIHESLQDPQAPDWRNLLETAHERID